MRVLVTGANGLVGKAVMEHLWEAGFHAMGVDIIPGHLHGFEMADLTDLGQTYDVFARKRPEAVVHLAANPNPATFPRGKVLVDNVASTHNVFQVAGDFGIKRMIFASSEMAMGYTHARHFPTQYPFKESEVLIPTNAYALSKRMGETIAESYSLKVDNSSAISLRINMVIHEEKWPWLSKLAKWIAEGAPENEDTDKHMTGVFWSYVDVDDVAEAVRRCLGVESTGHVVLNTVANQTISCTPTLELLRRYISPEAVWRGSNEDPFASPLDSSAMYGLLGWRPERSWRARAQIPDPEMVQRR